MFRISDGELSGPETYTGKIGEIISAKGGLKRGKMVNFKQIKGLVKEVHPSYLNNKDVRLLYFLCLLVQSGPSCKNLVKYFNKKPGKVTGARWITTATNILMLYMQTKAPSKNLILLTKIIVNIYGPAIFDIKQNWHMSSGPKHIFTIIQNSKKLLKSDHPSYYENVINTIKNNAFYLHIENMLVCMVHDDDLKIRRKALEVIEKARKYRQKTKSTKVRKFMKPTINFDADEYFNLIDIDSFKPLQFVSPPIFDGYSIDQIKILDFKHDYQKVPCHNQHVERFVALTSQAGEAVVGQEKRHQWILNKMKSTAQIPTKPTKKHFMKLAYDKVKVDGVTKKLFE